MSTDRNEKLIRIIKFVITAVLFAMSAFVITKMFMAALFTDTPREYRDYANVQITDEIVKGINPYTISEDVTRQHVYVYTPLTSVITAGLQLISGVGIVRLQFMVTFVFLISSSALAAWFVYKKTSAIETALLSFLLMTGTNYHAGFMGSAPGPLGVFILIVIFIMLDKEKDNKEKTDDGKKLSRNYPFYIIFITALLSVLLFYVKQYFAVCAISVAIYLFIRDKKGAVCYLLSCIILGLSSLYILDHYCPLFVFDTVYLFYSSTKGMVDSTSMYLVSLKKMVYFGVFYSPLFIVWIAHVVKRVRAEKRFRVSMLSIWEINTVVMAFILFFWLGKNNGSFITYHTQIMLPGLIISAAGAIGFFMKDLKEKKVFLFILFRAFTAVFFVAVIIWKGWYPKTLSNEEKSDWEYLYSRLDSYEGEYDDILLMSPVTGFYAMEHGLNDIDNGHNYLGEIEYDDSSVTKLLKTMGLLDELDLIYENALERTEIIQNKIDNGEYKAIFITENEGYAEVNTDLYELKDEMHLTTGTQASELNIYELKNEVEH